MLTSTQVSGESGLRRWYDNCLLKLAWSHSQAALFLIEIETHWKRPICFNFPRTRILFTVHVYYITHAIASTKYSVSWNLLCSLSIPRSSVRRTSSEFNVLVRILTPSMVKVTFSEHVQMIDVYWLGQMVHITRRQAPEKTRCLPSDAITSLSKHWIK